MAISYHIVDDTLVFETVGTQGFNEGVEVLQAAIGAYRAAAPPISRVLFDIRQTTESRTAEEIREIAVVVGEALPGSRLALCVSSDLHYGLSRMFAAFVSPSIAAVEVFRNETEAMEWLAGSD